MKPCLIVSQQSRALCKDVNIRLGLKSRLGVLFLWKIQSKDKG